LDLALGGLLSKDALDGGRGDAVPIGDLTDTLALASIPLDSCVIKYQRTAADVLAFEACAPHADARTRSTIKERSNSATTPMMVTTARPS
jgi:hypothetical protein